MGYIFVQSIYTCEQFTRGYSMRTNETSIDARFDVLFLVFKRDTRPSRASFQIIFPGRFYPLLSQRLQNSSFIQKGFEERATSRTPGLARIAEALWSASSKELHSSVSFRNECVLQRCMHRSRCLELLRFALGLLKIRGGAIGNVSPPPFFSLISTEI